MKEKPYNPVTKTPCPTCPYRKSSPTILSTERAQQIVDSIRSGDSFTCHCTDRRQNPNSCSCAGVWIICDREGFESDPMQLARRMKMADLLPGFEEPSPPKDDELFDNFDDFISAQEDWNKSKQVFEKE